MQSKEQLKARLISDIESDIDKANKEAVDKTVSFFYSDNWDLYPEFEAIERLLHWSDNFQGCNPFGLYLDLIGFSQEYFDVPCCPIDNYEFSSILGYKELCMLGDALNVFRNNGYEPVYKYIDHLISTGDHDD